MESKKNPKADVSRNGSIYFAVGLALMLFLTYSTLNYKTYDKSDIDIGKLNLDEELEEEIPIIEQVIPPPPPPPPVLVPPVAPPAPGAGPGPFPPAPPPPAAHAWAILPALELPLGILSLIMVDPLRSFALLERP